MYNIFPYTLLTIKIKNQLNAGKYTSPMDAMGSDGSEKWYLQRSYVFPGDFDHSSSPSSASRNHVASRPKVPSFFFLEITKATQAT